MHLKTIRRGLYMKKRTAFNLDNKINQKIEIMAKAQKRTRSAIVEMAIEELYK